ncbi:RNA polymerase sigma factor [Jiangella anatolica]|nr:sigma-70 family RNA polymerase sigma factor [Jiangella anatolica]
MDQIHDRLRRPTPRDNGVSQIYVDIRCPRSTQTEHDEPPERGYTPADRLDGEPLWQALATLPPRQRAVLVLRYYEDLTEGEIAVALGISTGTVKSRASRAMTKLRAALAETTGSPAGSGMA